MITVVSGIHRSGTSAMMGALIAGGIEPVYSHKRDRKMKMNDKKDYPVNPHGFYEVGQSEYMRLGFTTELPDEICVKIQAIGLPILAAAKGYKIIYMRRDPNIIKQSYIKSFGKVAFDESYSDWPTHYWNLLDSVKAVMQQRRDVELLEVQFNEMIDNPLKVFTQIQAMGVPIDIIAAVATIEPELRRYGNV